jgi:SAM-dependent methyltransferase
MVNDRTNMSQPLTTALPCNVATSETIQFLSRFPVGERPRALEIGCGAGDIALRLGHLGWQVLGIDIDPAIVAAAQLRGVDAVHADLLAFKTEAFDVVLVTHSLHHISPLDSAVDQIQRLVRPGGWLLVEEFDYSAMDGPTATWFYDRQDILEEAGVLRSQGPRSNHGDPLERFRAEHRHHGHGEHHTAARAGHKASGHEHLHAGSAMREAIEARFRVHFAERAAYLYRYLCAGLEPTFRGERLARLLLDQERSALDEMRIQPLGLRLAVRNEH